MEIGYIILVVAIYIFSHEFAKNYKRVQEVKDTPTTDIRYLENGRFEIQAEIDAESESIESPISQIECVWYALIIKEHVNRGKKSQWVIRKSSRKFKKCILNDGTGKCELDLSQIDFDLGTQYQGNSGTFDDPTDQERNVLLQSGIDPEGVIGFNRNFHYIEYVLRKGDNLYILGNCEEVQDSEYEVRIKGTVDAPIFISNKSEAEVIRKSESGMWIFGGVVLVLSSILVLLLSRHF